MPVIQAVQLADSAVYIAVKPWVAVADQGPATGEVNAALLEAFRARGIVIPYPQRGCVLLATSLPERGTPAPVRWVPPVSVVLPVPGRLVVLEAAVTELLAVIAGQLLD
jgi:hypothetical protein